MAQRRRTFQCQASQKTISASYWRPPQFRSLACANRGRNRRYDPVREQRDRRVLDLHGEGLQAFQIAKRLEFESGQVIAVGTVRTIVFRSKTASAGGGSLAN